MKTDTHEFMFPRAKCGQSTNVLKGLKVLQNTDAISQVASKFLEDGHYNKVLKAYLEILKLLDETVTSRDSTT